MSFNNPFGGGGGSNFGGGLGGGPQGGLPGQRSGGESVGPNDPLFKQPAGQHPQDPNAGDRTLLPKGSVPPGAHYDPLTPFDSRDKHTAGPDKDEARPTNYSDMP